jgi:hypothetical protein
MKRNNRSRNGKRSQDATRVSLFPFLAVLICTVGALVLLLVVVNRQGRVEAAKVAARKAAERNSEADKKFKEDCEDVRWRIGHLRNSLAATQKRLTEASLILGHVEEHSRELGKQLEQSKKLLDRLEQAHKNPKHKTRLARQLEEVTAKVEALKSQVEQARRDATKKPSSYAIVPYKGPYGTKRLPIYLECRSDAVVLQPEGVVFRYDDLLGSSGPGNPLAAALRAAREYLLDAGRFDPEKQGEPYPLLLVRPSGIDSYEAARIAMRSWGSEFGYELIDEDWKLEFGTPDPKLAQLVSREVAKSRRWAEMVAKAAPRHHAISHGQGGGPAGNAEYTVSSTTGVVVPYGGEPAGDTPRRQWRGGGDRPGYGHGSGQPGSKGTGVGGPSDSIAARGGPGAGSGSGSGLGTGSGTGSGMGSSAGGGSGLGDRPGLADGPGYGGTEAPNSPRLGGGPENPLRGPGAGNGGGGYGNREGMATGNPWAGPGEGLGQGTGGSPGQGGLARTSAALVGSSLGGSPGMGSGSPNSGGLAAQGAASNQAAGGTNGSVNGMVGGLPGSQAGMPSGASCNTANGTNACPGGGSASFGHVPTSNSSAAGSQGATSPPMPGARPDASQASSSNASGSPLRPGERNPGGSPGSQGASGGSASGRASSHRCPASIAAARGRNWAMPDTGPQATPLTKPIRVECRRDRLVLLADRGSTGGRKIPLGAQTRDAMDDFISAVWDHTENWGIAGDRMYWRPILHVYVAPGAESRYGDLEALLHDSGLLMKRKN